MNREQQLKPRLTDDFLGTLVEAVKVVGWDVDLIEVDKFIGHLFCLAGKTAPSLEAYRSDEEALVVEAEG